MQNVITSAFASMGGESLYQYCSKNSIARPMLCDIDGVLIDSRHYVVDLYHRALGDLGFLFKESEVGDAIWGNPWSVAYPLLGLSVKDAARVKVRKYALEGLERGRMRWEPSPFIELIRDDTIFVTGASPRSTAIKLEFLGLDDRVYVCGADKLNHEWWRAFLDGFPRGSVVEVVDDLWRVIYAAITARPDIVHGVVYNITTNTCEQFPTL